MAYNVANLFTHAAVKEVTSGDVLLADGTRIPTHIRDLGGRFETVFVVKQCRCKARAWRAH